MTEPFHRLFFAVRPPAEIVPEIARLRDSFGQAKGLVPDDRLHLTTWLFPDSQHFAADAADRANAAVATMPLRSFRIIVDRIVGSRGSVILLPSRPIVGFEAFQARLDHALRGVGLVPRAEWRFDPHITLLHGRHEIHEPIDALSWEAGELFLIDSIVGERRHDVIARWTLE